MATKPTVLSVNISEKKGTIKHPVPFIEITQLGVQDDAHAGPWGRQVSLLAKESIDKFSKEAGRKIKYGEFAENITTEGITLHLTKPLDRFVIGDTELEVTQIGKKCHGENCAIFREVGNCVMPKEGIFCRVIRTGKIEPGMEVQYLPKIYSVKVITLSDRAFGGIYEDKSGPRVKELMEDFLKKEGWQGNVEVTVLPDDPDKLKALLLELIDNKADLIFTTGGTGIGPRDFTPEIVRSVISKEIPGIMEHIRLKYGQEKPNALVSRSVAGVANGSLIYALPGSIKAVNEYMEEIVKTIRHSVYMLHSLDQH
jgi:molybdopterin adenylyltransferase